MISKFKVLIVVLAFLLCSNLLAIEINKEFKTNVTTDIPENRVIRINSNIDLHGGQLVIPHKTLIVFESDGLFSNGTIVGNETSIVWSNNNIFDNVCIKGTWKVPLISSKMFKTLSYVNSLNDILALSDDDIHNTIILDNELYLLAPIPGQLASAKLKSNTVLINNGVIKVLPNDLERHYALWCDGISNVIISGGVIQGDRVSHEGTSGEWGYGICATRTKNLNIENMEIYDCWGDCICLGVDNENVIITNCKLHDSRRQGITIAGKYNINVNNCLIYNIHGTEPQSAIDIEPDQNGSVSNVVIDQVSIINCKVGVQVYGGAKNVNINNVSINNVQVNPGYRSTWAFYIAFSDSVTINNCTVNSPKTNGIKIENCSGNIHLINNNINTGYLKLAIKNVGLQSVVSKGNNFQGKVENL